MKELLIIAVVLIVLFGSQKIPQLAESLVKAVRTLRGAFSADDAAPKKK